MEQEIWIREIRLAEATTETNRDRFDLAKQIRLVPKFTEESVDEYFSHFESMAVNMEWPQEKWTTLIQSTLTGKARRAFTALSAEERADYERVKQAILSSYELIPEAYRQKFRTIKKSETQSFREFVKEKE